VWLYHAVWTVKCSVNSQCSGLLIVLKKNGDARVRLDYRLLNNGFFLLSIISDGFNAFSESLFFSTMNLTSVFQSNSCSNIRHTVNVFEFQPYWISVTLSVTCSFTKNKASMSWFCRHTTTACLTKHGLYECVVMPVVLTNAPTTF